MDLGIGLYRHMLSAENYRFSRQIGCTHVVAHLVDYFRQRESVAAGDAGAAPPAGAARPAAADNQPVGTPEGGWGVAGSETEAGRITGPFARGGAQSVGVHGVDQSPLPLGMAWNMVYDPHAPAGSQSPVTSDQLWARVARFLDELVPVAEDAGVVLAAHPDDPPAPVIRGTPRLVYQPRLYQRLLDLKPSTSNALEFCLGRVLIPDHTPLPECDAPWHAGMAYAIGYMRAALAAV
ncbi:MAG TPA: mannonate dehydratase [Spirochaetia bacterium]|nr:mannonate dehydratase [Spirochaetia bacterium]